MLHPADLVLIKGIGCKDALKKVKMHRTFLPIPVVKGSVIHGSLRLNYAFAAF